jgi:ABC-type polysaccharide/polyol phosphate export permease
VSEHPRLVDVIHYGNFVTPAVESLRDPIFFGELPAAGDTVYLAVSALVSLALGALVFSRVDDRVAVEV